jgi:hypothetical protein
MGNNNPDSPCRRNALSLLLPVRRTFELMLVLADLGAEPLLTNEDGTTPA